MAQCLQCEAKGEGELGLCRRCRLVRFGQLRLRYKWTPQLIDELTAAYRLGKNARAAAIDKLEARTKWPRAVFHRRAVELGLSYHRQEWTAAEDEYLSEHMGVETARAIGRRLGRSTGSVVARAARLELSGRVKEGYCTSDLAAVLGVGSGTVRGWMRRGLLGAIQEREGSRAQEDAVVRFLRRYPGEYDLRRVDQIWFKSMIFRRPAESLSVRSERME